MANLFFKYSSMDAGKSTALLQAAHNYKHCGMTPFLLTAAIDDRYGVGKITSRLGLSSDAYMFNNETDVFELIEQAHLSQKIDCVLVDECQFLTKGQVHQLSKLVDNYKIPVLCYGLRTDFQGELFEGSQYLLAWADKIEEIKTICHCGKKATMVLRQSQDGTVIRDGDQIAIGGNDLYRSVCRKHFTEAFYK